MFGCLTRSLSSFVVALVPDQTNQQRLSQCFGRYLGAYSHKAHLVNLYLGMAQNSTPCNPLLLNARCRVSGTNFPTDSEQDSEQAASAEDQKVAALRVWQRDESRGSHCEYGLTGLFGLLLV